MNKTIFFKWFYFRINEWHHLYLGFIWSLIGWFLILYNNESLIGEILRFIGIFTAVDDFIQHVLQGIWLTERFKHFDYYQIFGRKVIFFKSGKKRIEYLPSFLIYTILYKYWRINRFGWINKITSLMNKLFGAKK